MSDVFSVILPVFNEEHGLAERVALLLDGLPEACEIIYVCNGCTDCSEAILRAFADDRIRVLDCPKGKARALRLGERHASLFPRFFVDSDVSISGTSLTKLAAALDEGTQIVSPAIVFDLSGSSWAAKAVSNQWLSLPHGRNQAFHHVLGISELGRTRWGSFPDVIADDSFMESHFLDQEKAIVRHVTVVTRPPRCLFDWIRVRIRWDQGDRQLRKLGIALPRTEGQRRELIGLLTTPKTSFPAMLYLTIVMAARLLSNLRLFRSAGWLRDGSSRNGRA